jgi:hypothetical protein
MLEKTNGTIFCGVNKNIKDRSSNLEIFFSGFPREKRHIWENSRKDGLTHLGYSITRPITQFLLFLLTILN